MADGLRRKILKVLNGFSPRRKELTVLIILQGKRKNHRKEGEGMTVKDLLEQLQELNPDKRVVLQIGGNKRELEQVITTGNDGYEFDTKIILSN